MVKKIGFFLIVLLIFFLLILRFKLALSLIFNPDEIGHLYRASLISIGEKIYRDFSYGYSPFFVSFLTPLFMIFRERVEVVFWARELNFIVFFLNTTFVYLIGKKLFNSRTGILAAFFWVFFPTILTKTLEVRPDHLGIFFWLSSLLLIIPSLSEKRFPRQAFFAGLLYGLALTVTPKMLIAYFGLLVFLLFGRKVARPSKEVIKSFLIFHLGVATVGILIWLILWAAGVFEEAFYNIVVLPREIVGFFGKTYFEPLYPFMPNDSIYGEAGYSLPWAVSVMGLFLGVIAIFQKTLKIAFTKVKAADLFLVVSFLSFAGALLFIFLHSLVQYYIPLGLIISLALADGWYSLESFFVRIVGKKKQRLAEIGLTVLLTVLLFVLTSASWRLIKTHLGWTNQPQVDLIARSMAISQPDDYFFDMMGYHFFRRSAYWFCCEVFPSFEDYLTWPLPDFVDELKRTKTKYLIENWRLTSLDEKTWSYIKNNYTLSEDGIFWIAN